MRLLKNLLRKFINNPDISFEVLRMTELVAGLEPATC